MRRLALATLLAAALWPWPPACEARRPDRPDWLRQYLVPDAPQAPMGPRVEVVESTKVFLDDKPATMKDIPADATVELLQVEKDGRTLKMIRFRSPAMSETPATPDK
jgi:hypothetical protein